MLLAALTLLVAQDASPAQPAESNLWEAPIASVTVYSGRALILRRAEVPAGGGSFRLAGLPMALDAASVRARTEGDEVISVEVRERSGNPKGLERFEQLGVELEVLNAELEALQSELRRVERIEQHLWRLLDSQADPATQGEAAADRIEQWEATLDFVERRASEVEVREAELKSRETKLEAEIGIAWNARKKLEQEAKAPTREIEIEVLDLDGVPSRVEVEYLVEGASWKPIYDLRAELGYSQAELVFRAEVTQATGEDWNGVEVALSTAQIRRGVSGPEARERQVWLRDDSAALRGSLASGMVAAAAPPPPAAAKATVDASGVYVRYVLPRRESLPSSKTATTVLVGRDSLELQPERRCVPEEDLGVWVVGRTLNTTPFVLLEGSVSLFVGGEYLGVSSLPRTSTQESIELPLGLDPKLRVEREQIDERVDKPGVFGSRAAKVTAWRTRLISTAAEPLTVLVQESLPQSTDSRIEVKLDKSSVSPSTEKRFAELREERGVLTFPVRVAPGRTSSLDWTLRVTYPDSQRLVGGQ